MWKAKKWTDHFLCSLSLLSGNITDHYVLVWDDTQFSELLVNVKYGQMNTYLFHSQAIDQIDNLIFINIIK